MNTNIVTVLLILTSVSFNLFAKEQAEKNQLTDDQIKSLIIQESISNYSGSCPCPYNLDRAGRKCGKRSAYSKPGGAEPICYPSQISERDVAAFRKHSE
ncbi:hypothetical protein TW73_08860 [Pseudoalteromonas piscicida]|nr:hypothetical protein TW73_08860 [Pseudoalteromonas piscicida]